ncbi:MAG: class I SAM-dependent methyltransferase [Candidatus Bathyarchaeota archaeon]|nr:class I SAM-dependent methyltransferase [Candidatus Bathyarchaeota archaeon]
MQKFFIRRAEDELPTISESFSRMSKTEKIHLLSIYNQAKKMVRSSNANVMLDVGCGDGLLLTKIHSILSANSCSYVGVDISIRKLRAAKRKSALLYKNCDFILCDADFLPFKGSTFQSVTMIEVFEHFLNPRSIIIELSRVISDKGLVFITTPSALGITKLLLSKVSKKHRPEFIVLNGHKLPHRDFNPDEIMFFVRGYFKTFKLYSFNISLFQSVIRFLPFRLGYVSMQIFDRYVDKMPIFLGSNLSIVLQSL